MKKLILILILFIFTILFSDTEILRPNAAGDETDIPAQTPSSTSHYDKVDEAVSDGSTTTVSTSSGSYLRDLYDLPNHSGKGTINSVTIYFNMSANDGNYYVKPSQKSGSTVTDGTEIIRYEDHGSYTLESQTYILNPATSSAYTWEEIDALQIGISIRNGDEGTRCTQVYVEIDYTAPSGWTGTIGGVEAPAAVGGLTIDGIFSIGGVE